MGIGLCQNSQALRLGLIPFWKDVMNSATALRNPIFRYGFHATLIVGATALILLTLVVVENLNAPKTEQPGPGLFQTGFAAKETELDAYFGLTARDLSIVKGSLNTISENWHPGSATMIVEIAQFATNPRANTEIFSLMESETGQRFGTDFEKWRQWIWKQDYDPHPQYAKFKSALYSRIDPRFAEYFRVTKDSKIRLDEIRWGGVIRDGIPPLKNPKMLAATDAGYLADTDVVFGITLNGDARCYPKRILAWHEMFKDTIGGESVCGVY